MIGNAPYSPYTDVPGWLETDEEDTLIEYAKTVPEGGVIVNVGVEFGRSMAAFVKYAPTATVYGIEINPLDAYSANLTEAANCRQFERQGDARSTEEETAQQSY